MPRPGNCHLRGPVISMLNHICESDIIIVGIYAVCPRLRVQRGGQRSSTEAAVWNTMKSVGNDALRAAEQATTNMHRRIYTFHAQSEEQTHAHTQASSTHQAHLVIYNVSMGSPLFQTEHMVQAQKTKQTGWPPQCTVHEVRLVFPSPLTRSIYKNSKSTLHLWLGLHTYIPVIIQRCITKRFLFHLCSPAFCFAELCLVWNVDQLQSRETDRVIVKDKWYFIKDKVSDVITQTKMQWHQISLYQPSRV